MVFRLGTTHVQTLRLPSVLGHPMGCPKGAPCGAPCGAPRGAQRGGYISPTQVRMALITTLTMWRGK